MTIKIENIRVEKDGCHYGLEDVGPLVSFDLNGKDHIEFLDDDGTLCAAHESNLHNFMDTDTANATREALRDWLATNACIVVDVNDVDDFFVLNAAADADDDAIAHAIEAENRIVGGSECNPIFDGYNRVHVFRNGVEVTSLKQEERTRPYAA